MVNFRICANSILVLFLFGSGQVLAESGGQVMEEIVVTAQKREESLSKVPVSVQAISGSELVEMGITDVKELYKISPSVVTIGGASAGSSGLKIRGIGNPGYGEGIEGSVGVMLDGITTGSGGSAMSNLFDVERVEVLRGPQGTLFGKNATAGLVAIVSKRPTREFEASGWLRYAEAFEDTQGEFSVSGPATEELSLRAAGIYRKRNDGQTETPVVGGTDGDLDRKGVRLSGLWEQGGLSALLSGMYVEDKEKCCARIMVGLNDDPATYGAILTGIELPALADYGATPGDKNNVSVNELRNDEKIDTYHAVLDISYEFDTGSSIRSITGYRNWKSNSYFDSDTTPRNIVNTPALRKTVIKSQEVQYLSNPDRKFTYILGIYIDNVDFTRNHRYEGGTDFPTVGGGTFGSTQFYSQYTIGNYAVYGNAQYQLTDQLSVFAGARGLVETNKLKGCRVGDHFLFPGDYCPERKAEDNDTNWTATAGIEYQINDSTMTYLRGARGYKGKAANFSVNGDLYLGDPADAFVDPEKVWSAEVGLKTILMDQRLTLNAAAFYQYYDDYQADSVDADSVVRTLRNAGKLESKGIEADIAGALWTGMTVTGNLSYTNAQFKNFKGGPCTVNQALGVPNCVQDLSGNDLPAVPKWAYNLIAQQDLPAVKGIRSYVRAEYSWRDDITYDLDLDPYTKQDAFGLANFRLGFLPNDNLEIVGFVENAFDEHYSYYITDYTLMSGAYAGYIGTGRTYGLELRAHF